MRATPEIRNRDHEKLPIRFATTELLAIVQRLTVKRAQVN